MNPSPRNHQRPVRHGAATARVTFTFTFTFSFSFSVSNAAPGLPDPVVWSDQAQGLLARLSVVPSGSSADSRRVARPAVTDVAGAAVRQTEVRDRLAAAQGNTARQLPLSYKRAMLELAYGQVLRRAGQRRAAASQLQVARDRLSTLNARPDVERCDRELAACGLTPAKRSEFNPNRLTPQESAVAGLVATGMINREVATELSVSIKTVQFHLTHIYTKLGINTRGKLAARFREQNITDDDQRSSSGSRPCHGLKFTGRGPERTVTIGAAATASCPLVNSRRRNRRSPGWSLPA
jgi:DNA-binding CsgD family transcriptional regulator